jgi:hypothetical protein
MNYCACLPEYALFRAKLTPCASRVPAGGGAADLARTAQTSHPRASRPAGCPDAGCLDAHPEITRPSARAPIRWPILPPPGMRSRAITGQRPAARTACGERGIGPYRPYHRRKCAFSRVTNIARDRATTSDGRVICDMLAPPIGRGRTLESRCQERSDMAATMRAERFYADTRTVAVEDVPIPESLVKP